MGNETSKSDYLTFHKDDVERNHIKMQNLEAQWIHSNHQVSNLTITNNKLESTIGTLTNEKLHLMASKDELLKKCEQLEKSNETSKRELAKYQSVPALKQILDLYENLQVLRKDIKDTENDMLIDEQSMDFTVKISGVKKENKKMEDALKQKSLSLLQMDQMKQLVQIEDQLTQTEKKLETIQTKWKGFSEYKQKKVSFITEKIKTCMNEFDKISETISKVEDQLKDYQKEFAEVQNKGKQLKKQEQEKYENTLSILNKQRSVMSGLMKLANLSEASLETDYHADDNISEISESDSVCLSEDGKNHYAIVLYNLAEDGNDQHRVISIINNIASIPTKDIEVQRMSAYNSNKVRPIKVLVSNLGYVKSILSNRWKLKESVSYQHIRIVPFKKGESKDKQPNRREQEKKATLTSLNPFEINSEIDHDADDNISEISESESVFLSDDGRQRYAIMLYNLKEDDDDRQRVIDIISSISSMYIDEIEVQRLGAYNSYSARPIKVFVPTFRSVSEILSNKWKLKQSSCHQHIRIAPFNQKKRASQSKCQMKNLQHLCFPIKNFVTIN